MKAKTAKANRAELRGHSVGGTDDCVEIGLEFVVHYTAEPSYFHGREN